MDYTENIHLPQWVKSDRIMMDDFNEAMDTLDNSLYALQLTANYAKNTAAAAQTLGIKAYSPDNPPFHCGSYTGSANDSPLDIIFSKQPKFLIICGMESTVSYTDSSSYDRYFCATSGTVLSDRVELTKYGFRVYPRGTGHGNFPDLNEKGRVYNYIAFL